MLPTQKSMTTAGCGGAPRASILSAVPTETAIVVSDAHLGQVPASIGEAFHRFLAAVPTMAEHLVVNGDLFDFWFEYRTVIPRNAFRTLAALAGLRDAGVRLTVTGGNHDRWGRDFWERDVGATFHRHDVELNLAGFRALVTHGDGLDGTWSAKLLQAITRFPLTPALFRWIHPDLGITLVRRMSRTVAKGTRRAEMVRNSAAAQAVYARAVMASRADLDLLVFGHTHVPVLESVGPRRWYTNPGAWMEGLRYLEVNADGPALRRFSASTP